MQNGEQLRKKSQYGSQKTTCRERRKNFNFQGGGGINIFFEPKYRPLNVKEIRREETKENGITG